MAKPLFYDLNVHCGNISRPDEMVRMAQYLGFNGIGIKHEDLLSGKIRPLDLIEDCEEKFDPEMKNSLNPAFKLLTAIEIRVSKAAQLHGLIGKHRKNADVLIVRGGDETINRLALENPNVDVLSYPLTSRDGGLNHVLAKEASLNNVAVAFDLGPLVKGRGGKRVRTLSHYRANLMLLRKYNVPMILTCNASSYFDLRAPRELIALSSMFGMEKEEAIRALSDTPLAIIRNNIENDRYICEGVEILEESDINTDAESRIHVTALSDEANDGYGGAPD